MQHQIVTAVAALEAQRSTIMGGLLVELAWKRGDGRGGKVLDIKLQKQ